MKCTSLNKLVLLRVLADKNGFKMRNGFYEKSFPSGIVWRFSFHGSDPHIEDAHGRRIRSGIDGITTVGMLLNLYFEGFVPCATREGVQAVREASKAYRPFTHVEFERHKANGSVRMIRL